MRNLIGVLASCLVIATAVEAYAQADAIVVPNGGRIHIGDVGALEAGAMIARSNDGAASWYNPAGLVRAIRPSVSGNASLYELNKVTIGSGAEAEDQTTLNIIPSYLGSVGFIGNNRKAAWGFSVTTPVAWKSTASEEKESGSAGSDLVYTRYNSSAELKSLVPTVALAYALSESFSVGLAAHFHYTTEYWEYSDYIRNDNSKFFNSSAITQDSQGLQGQLSMGASWRPNDILSLGVVIKSPSLNLYDNTSYTYNYLLYNYDSVSSEYATNSKLDYVAKKPAEAGIGIALEQPGYGFEADAIYRMKIKPYDQYNGEATYKDVEVDNLGTITTWSTTFSPDDFAENAVFNCRIGGHVAVTDSVKWHLGVFTDKSSLKNSDAYQKVDLYGVTTGVSITDKNSSVGVGASYTWSGDMSTEVFDSNVNDYVAKDSKLQILGLILSGKYYF